MMQRAGKSAAHIMCLDSYGEGFIFILSIAIQAYAGFLTLTAEEKVTNTDVAQILIPIFHILAGISALNHIFYCKYLIEYPEETGWTLQTIVFNLEAISGLLFALATTDVVLLAQNPEFGGLDIGAIVLVWAQFIAARVHLSFVLSSWSKTIEPASEASKRAHGCRIISLNLLPINVVWYLINFIPLYVAIWERSIEGDSESAETERSKLT